MIKPRAPSHSQHAPELNIDFRQRVIVDTARQAWMASPSSKVWRKPLEREAAEHGHTTSIVRFETGSSFPRHEHPRGEEILVLDGVFSDEHADYGPGTYIRNPPGSAHSPFCREGCLLFVNSISLTPRIPNLFESTPGLPSGYLGRETSKSCPCTIFAVSTWHW
jgi:hypothetical protein